MIDHDISAAAQLAALTAQASTQTTHAFGLVTVAAVLGGALIALAADTATSTVAVGFAAAAGVVAGAYAGVALCLSLQVPPWPSSPELLERHLSEATQRVVARRALLGDATIALYIMSLATLVTAITAV